ncbi:MAG: alanine:cation symporter family protein [Mycoplasma sp.]
MGWIIHKLSLDIFIEISKFTNGWIYAGIILGVSLLLTITFKFFQFTKMRQMYKSFSITENHFEKKVSPIKVFISSLASRFGLGNVIGVGIALMIGGFGAIPWIIIVGFLSMSTSFAECTLAQIFHEKDPTNPKTFRGGTSYYIIKGLGKNWKILAIAYAIASFLAKGFFIISSATGTIANQLYLTFFHQIEASQNGITAHVDNSLIGSLMPWIIVIIYLLIVAFIIFKGEIKHTLDFLSKMLPIVLVIAAVIIVTTIIANFSYFTSAIEDMFESAFNPNHPSAFCAAAIGVTIQQGISRGLFAHEAGQGSTTQIAAIPKLDHPVKMGFGQALAIFVDTFVICGIMGIFFSILFMKAKTDLQLSPNWIQSNLGFDGSNTQNQQNFINYCINNIFSNNLEIGRVFNRIFGILFTLLFFTCGLGVTLGGIIITELTTAFLFRKKSNIHQKYASITLKLFILISIGTSPLIQKISPNIFTFADAAVALCFLINLLSVVCLIRVVQKAFNDYEKQLTIEALKYATANENINYQKLSKKFNNSLKNQNIFMRLISKMQISFFESKMKIKYYKKLEFKMHFDNRKLNISNKESGSDDFESFERITTQKTSQ